MMKYRIIPFEKKMTDEALNLFRSAYQHEKRSSILLPDRALNDKAWIKQAMLLTNCNMGVAALAGDELVGYMLANFQFDFKGQQAIIIREYSHASLSKDKDLIYQLMYAYLGEELLSEGLNLHIIWHFAHDDILKETLFQFGFGAFMAGQLRDLSPLECNEKIHIFEEKDFMSVADLHVEQAKYVLDSPIFIVKNTESAAIKESLKKYTELGHTLMVYYENKAPMAYFILGDCDENQEDFLLLNSGTVQIMYAYATPSARGKGIGKALLAKAIDWAREKKYKRLFVAHETANIYGGNFWRKHFHPFLYCSMRYIDNKVSGLKDRR